MDKLGNVVSVGGRVLAVTTKGKTIEAAQKLAYQVSIVLSCRLVHS